MAPEAKDALFNRFGNTYRSDLDKIAAATSRAREVAQTLPNVSNSTTLGFQGGAWATLGLNALMGNFGAAALVGGGMAGANVMARAFTNPRLMRWMA